MLFELVKNCDTLIAVRSLPDIVLLTKLLSNMFHTQFTRKQAKEMLIKDLLGEHLSDFNLPKEKLDELVHSFVKAWNIAVSLNECESNLNIHGFGCKAFKQYLYNVFKPHLL